MLRLDAEITEERMEQNKMIARGHPDQALWSERKRGELGNVRHIIYFPPCALAPDFQQVSRVEKYDFRILLLLQTTC